MKLLYTASLSSMLSFSAQATLVLSGEVEVGAAYDITSPTTFSDTDQQTDAFFGPGGLTTLSAAVNLDATQGVTRANVKNNIEATWDSADVGQVRFEDVGWQTENTVSGTLQTTGFGWVYRFVAEEDGVFNLSWDLAFDPDNIENSFGIAFDIAIAENNVSTLTAGILGWDLPSFSSVSLDLQAGDEYRVQIRHFSNITFASGDQFAFVDAIFDWNINAVAVPEPAALSVVLSGFGLLFWQFRSRRSALS